jgi:medium-chain acyl-[acyl-carrier-protein] hydrolase
VRRHTCAKWFDQRFRLRTPKYSLYCFPFAGGAATYYAEWADRFRGPIELVPVQLPGRGPRMAEPLATRIEDLAHDIAMAIAEEDTVPLLFGHSMGAIIAFEVARRLQSLGRPAAHLSVSGRPAPLLSRPAEMVSQLPHAEIVQVLRDYGAADEEILQHEELLAMLMPIIRADFAMIESYRYEPGPPLECPISSWCGTADPEIDLEEMQGWAEETTGGWSLFGRPGGHFFLSQHVEEISRVTHEAVAHADDEVYAGVGGPWSYRPV